VLFAYYVILKFHWSSAMVGAALAVVGMALGLVYLLLIRMVTPKIGETNSVYLDC